MERYVMEVDVVRTALCNPEGPSAHVISQALADQSVILTSYPLFTEYESELMRPSLWGTAGIVAWQACDFLDGLAAIMRLVNIPAGWLPRLQDELSELSLVAAVEGDADAIISIDGAKIREEAKRNWIDVLTPQQAAKRGGYVQ